MRERLIGGGLAGVGTVVLTLLFAILSVDSQLLRLGLTWALGTAILVMILRLRQRRSRHRDRLENRVGRRSGSSSKLRRSFGIGCAVILFVAAFGLVTDAIGESIRLILLFVGGTGLGLLGIVERREDPR